VAASGQIYVADFGSAAFGIIVVRIDPKSGVQTLVAEGVPLGLLHGIAIMPKGDILVSGGGFNGTDGALILISPATVTSDGRGVRRPPQPALCDRVGPGAHLRGRR
jgi:hypothetical protein